MEVVVDQIKGVLQNVLKLNATENIKPETRLFDDLNLDSTASFELLIALEDVIPGLVIDPDTLERHHFETVGNLAQYVLKHSQTVN